MSVHQECYGIKKIPSGEWVCELCQEHQELGRLMRCPLCPCRGGVLRRTITPSNKSFFSGKNESYTEYFRKAAVAQAKMKAAQKGGNQDNRKTKTPEASKPLPPKPEKNGFAMEYETDGDTLFDLGKRNEFDMGTIAAPRPPPKEQQDASPPSDNPPKPEAKKSLRMKKKISKLKRQKNLLHHKPVGVVTTHHISEPYYKYQELDFHFTPEELAQEPAPTTMWIHMSCMYWIPEIYFNNSQFPIDVRNLKGIDKEKFRETCIICGTTVGACVKCSAEDCQVKFHVECARRANIHLELVTEYQTKFNIHCAAHTPRLLSNLISANNKKTQEEVVKFYKYLQRVFRAQEVPFQAPTVSETSEMMRAQQKTVQMFSVETSEDEDVEDPRSNRQRIELCQIARFLSDKSRAIMAKVRKHVLQRPAYQFTIQLRRVPEAPGQFEFVDSTEPKKLLYKNFVHKKDRLWVDMRRSSEEGWPILHDKFKYLVNFLKGIRKRHAEFFRRDRLGNLVLIKSIEGEDAGGNSLVETSAPMPGTVTDPSDLRCEKCLKPWNDYLSVGDLISM